MVHLRVFVCLFIACLCTPPVFATEVIDSQGMTVFGDDNGPKNMTLIPWKRQMPDVDVEGFVFSVSDEVFRPLDRKAFLRQVGYYKQVFGDSGNRTK